MGAGVHEGGRAMLMCRDGVRVDNRTDRDEICALDSATARACLEGSLFERARACGKLSDGELFQVFGEKRITYARALARAGRRLVHPLVVEALKDASARAVIAAGRWDSPEAQLRAASLACARAVLERRSRPGRPRSAESDE